MRAVHVFAVLAAFAVGAGIAPMDRAQAQGILDMSPPADSSAQIGQPKYDDIKFQTGTALPPKTGSVIFFNGPRRNELTTATGTARRTARPIKAK
jgi:hypothetical protein